MATHSNILAWEIPWTEEPGRLYSMVSQRVGQDWASKQQSSHCLSSLQSWWTHKIFLKIQIWSRDSVSQNFQGFQDCLQEACGLLFRPPGIEPQALSSQSRVLTTELPGRSPSSFILCLLYTYVYTLALLNSWGPYIPHIVQLSARNGFSLLSLPILQYSPEISH